MHSVQAADLVMPLETLNSIWSPLYLERLARTYWRFITRISLGLLRVSYRENERAIVCICRPFVLLRFIAPEYELDDSRGVVRWRVERGLLVSRRGRGGKGYLEIEVKRFPPEDGRVRAHIKLEVANFYPAIAAALSTRIYRLTQSKIHVLVTHSFLRSLARLDLAKSKIGTFETT